MKTSINPLNLIAETTHTGRCFASFGELLQGILPSEEHFLVTLPVNVESCVSFFSDYSSDITVYPPSKKKTLEFIKKVKTEFSLDLVGSFVIESDIPEGKGLSGSTADMIAALRAIESYYDCTFKKSIIDSILRSIEPSDGLLYEGSVLYYHRKCQFIRALGKLPKMAVLSVDFGGMIDTLTYNKTEKIVPFFIKQEYESLLGELSEAFLNQDLVRIGEVATRSALLNQKFNFKKELDAIIKFSSEIGALGVINTHSGTCLGLLIDSSTEDPAVFIPKLRDLFPLETISLYHTM